MTSRHRVREVDGLRFFAIAGVLAVHYRPPFHPHLDILALGWSGVDLFFVISGFLITNSLLLLRGRERPYRQFYWHRILRILPPYYLVLIVVTALCAMTGVFPGRNVSVKLALFLTSILSWPAPHGLPFNEMQLSLQHGIYANDLLPLDEHVLDNYIYGLQLFWSLSVEELFYLVWAPLVLRGSRAVVAAVSMSVLLLCPLIRVLCHVPGYSEYFFFPARFDALTFGALLSLSLFAIRDSTTNQKRAFGVLKILLLGSSLLLCALLWHDGAADHHEVRSALSFSAFGYTLLGCTFTSLTGLCVLKKDSEIWWARFLRLRPLSYVGQISYMIYLIHIPIYVTLLVILRYVLVKQIMPSLLLGWIATLLTILVATISWKYYEKPLSRFKSIFSKTCNQYSEALDRSS